MTDGTGAAGGAQTQLMFDMYYTAKKQEAESKIDLNNMGMSVIDQLAQRVKQ